jgi:thiamine-monophosphate kinase
MSKKEPGEFEWIQEITPTPIIHNPSLVKGIGDDCAVYQTDSQHQLVTTDALVEGIHFKLEWTSFDKLGWKTLAVNISDIAAMGGIPQFAVISGAIPPHISFDSLRLFHQGVLACGNRFQVDLIGGDTTRSPTNLFFSVTLIGTCLTGKVAFRTGGAVGEGVFVSGYPGKSALGLWMLSHGYEPQTPWEQSCIDAHLEPMPQIDLGHYLASHGICHAMLDTSDGLSQDATRLIETNEYGIELEWEKIPIQPELISFCTTHNINLHDIVLHGGEDYQILYIASHPMVLPAHLHSSCYEIGITVAEPGLWLRSNGKRNRLESKGYDHFKVDNYN